MRRGKDLGGTAVLGNVDQRNKDVEAVDGLVLGQIQMFAVGVVGLFGRIGRGHDETHVHVNVRHVGKFLVE